MKEVTKREIWDAMDGDTQSFVEELCAPFETEIEVEELVEGNPKPVKVTKTVTERITIDRIELKNKSLFWEK